MAILGDKLFEWDPDAAYAAKDHSHPQLALLNDGEQGEQGWPGKDGAPGGAGSPGNPGAAGQIGPAVFMLGDQGEEGERGQPGKDGAVGVQGNTGAQGPIGPACHLLNDLDDSECWPQFAIPQDTHVGTVTTPAVPASTVAIVNTTGRNVTMFIKAGTLTVITLGGVVTGIAAAAPASTCHIIPLAARQTIAITYSVAPTWVWVAG